MMFQCKDNKCWPEEVARPTSYLRELADGSTFRFHRGALLAKYRYYVIFVKMHFRRIGICWSVLTFKMTLHPFELFLSVFNEVKYYKIKRITSPYFKALILASLRPVIWQISCISSPFNSICLAISKFLVCIPFFSPSSLPSFHPSWKEICSSS